MARNTNTRNWANGDILATHVYGSDQIVTGVIIDDTITTYGGAGYALKCELGGMFYGTDKSLLVQCSGGVGGDPADQCEQFVSARAMYCAEHEHA